MEAKYHFGLPFIDEEHKTLFKIAEELKKGLENEIVVDLFLTAAQLYEYVITHLEHEEQLIRDWEMYREHVSQHKRLKYKLDNVFGRINNPFFIDQSALLLELHDLVVEWLQIHILQEDAKYVGYLKAKEEIEELFAA